MGIHVLSMRPNELVPLHLFTVELKETIIRNFVRYEFVLSPFVLLKRRDAGQISHTEIT